MEFYLVLSLATIVITGLTVLMWQKTRTFAFPLGIAFMYFWTLYGGWRIVRSLDGSSDETVPDHVLVVEKGDATKGTQLRQIMRT